MDALSSAVVDVILTTGPLPRLLNVIHPHPVAWRDIFNAINKASGASLPFVPYSEWLTRLEEVATQETSQEVFEQIVSHLDSLCISLFSASVPFAIAC